MGSLKRNLEDITLLDMALSLAIYGIYVQGCPLGGELPPIKEGVHPPPHRHFPPLSDQIFPMGFACVSAHCFSYYYFFS